MSAPKFQFQGPRTPLTPVGDVGGDLKRWMSEMSSWMATREGSLGDGSGQMVTMADLESLGLVADATKGIKESYDFTSSSADPNAPSAPRNLIISPEIWANVLAWENPSDADLSHIEVWVAVNSQHRDDASLIAVVTKPNATFTHGAISAQSSYTYWIRAIDYAGNHSPWCPPDAQGGYVAPPGLENTIHEVLTTLQGRITENQLYQSLTRRIDLIDTDRYTVDYDLFDTGIIGGLVDFYAEGSRKQLQLQESFNSLQATAIDHLARLNALDSQVSVLIAKDFDQNDTYAVGDYVRYEGKVYKCIEAITSLPAPYPTNAGYWVESPDIVTLVSGIQTQVDTITNTITTLVTRDTFDVLASRVTTAESAIIQNADAIILKADKASLDVLTNEVTSLATEVGIHAGNFTVLTTSIAGDLALLEGIAEHGVTVESFADVLGLDNRLAMAGFRMDAAEAAINLRATKIDLTTVQDALTTRIANAEVDISALDGVTLTHSKHLETLDQATGNHEIRIGAAEVNISSLDGVTLTHSQSIGVLDTLTGELKTRTLAAETSINALTGITNTHTTDIAAAQETLNSIEGQWTVKLQQWGTRKAVAGVGLTLDPLTSASEFMILADKFMVVNPANTVENPKVPFVIGAVDGVSTVGIDGSMVVDGTIRTRHLDAGLITGDKLSANLVMTNKISSGNYSPGGSGWQLTNTGGEFNTGVAINGNLLVNGTIAGTKIAGGTITGDKIAGDTITGNNIVGATLTGNHIAANSLYATNVLVPGSIAANMIGANQIVGYHIAADTIEANKIKAGSIDASRIMLNGIDISRISSGVIPEVGAGGGDARFNYAGASLSTSYSRCIFQWFIKIWGYGRLIATFYLNGGTAQEISFFTPGDGQGGYISSMAFIPYVVVSGGQSAGAICWNRDDGRVEGAYAYVSIIPVK